MPSNEAQTVLIVEDEPIILLGATDILEEGGITTLQATNAKKALELLEVHPETKLVFTDIDLNGPVDGLALGSEIKRRWPSIGIILTSGYNISRSMDLPPDTKFISKPYFDRDLLELVRATLDSCSRGPS